MNKIKKIKENQKRSTGENRNPRNIEKGKKAKEFENFSKLVNDKGKGENESVHKDF